MVCVVFCIGFGAKLFRIVVKTVFGMGVLCIGLGANLYRIVFKTGFGNAGFPSFLSYVLEQSYIE